MIYESGTGEDSPATPAGLNTNVIGTVNFDDDVQLIFGLMLDYGERPSTRGPEPGDPFHATNIAGKGMESPNEKDYNNIMKITDRNDDPKRFIRKGAIYYDSNLQQTFERDTDSSGIMTDKPAKDTLPLD